MLCLSGSILARVVGRQRGHFEKGTWMRSPTRVVVSGFLKAKSPDRPMMHLNGAEQFTFLASSLRGTKMRAR